MTVSRGLRVLRERWFVCVAGLLFGLLVAAVVSAGVPNTYTATSSVYVTETPGARATGSDTAPGLFFSERVASYRQLVTSGQVLDQAAAALGLPGRESLAGRVTASTPTGSTIVAVTATGGDPENTVRVANAVAQSFVATLGMVERAPESPAFPLVHGVVTDPASAPVTPASPRTAANLVLGATVGLLASVAWVLGRAATDTTVRSVDELRAASGTPVLGVLPRARRRGWTGRGRRPVMSDADLVAAARRVRDHLILTESGSPGRVVTMCGVGAGAGTTTTVVAVGTALASSSRVLLVDANLRAPALGDRSGSVDVPGLSDVLSGELRVEEAVRSVDGVDVLAAGSPAADPGELLGSSTVGDVMSELSNRYDRVLVDCPPLALALDGALVSRHADLVVLVCRAGAHQVEDVDSAVRALQTASAPTAGAVLTVAAAARARSGSEERRSAPSGTAVSRAGRRSVAAERPTTSDTVGSAS